MFEKTNRVPEIELMKAIGFIGMIYVYVLEGSLDAFVNVDKLPGYIPYTLVEFLGGIPAVGVFMFAMGWGASHSDRSTVKTFLMRALKLGLLAFLVNFMCEILPGLIDPENFGSFFDHPWAIICFNIYGFAALSMIFFAIMKWAEDNLILRGVFSLVIVLAIFAVTFMVKPETYEGNQWIATLINIFLRQNCYSWYSIVPWGIFPIMGYWAGWLYRWWNNRFQFAISSLAIGVIFVPVSIVFLKMKNTPLAAADPGGVTPYDYYSLTIWNLICAIGIVCLEMAIAFGILTLTRGKLPEIILDISRHIMGLFLMQWVFISPMLPLLLHISDVWIIILLGTIVAVATYVSLKLLNNLYKNFWRC